MEEIFKRITIRGVELEVSNLGNVLKDGVPRNKRVNHDGYLVVSVNNRGIGIHRLVALAFIHNDDPENKKEVNHKDFDRQNNIVTNLEWMSHADNVRYSHENNRHKPRFGKDNPNYGNKKLSKFYRENPKVALEKQSRKGLQNGRCTPIELYKDNNLIKKFDYIGDCCEYLHKNHGFSSNNEVIRCGIRRSMNKNVPYKGFTFKK